MGWQGLGMKPWFQGITSNLKTKEDTTKNLQTTTSSQLECELQSQDKYLQSQDTEMGVSKNALSNYSTIKGIPTQLLGALLLFGAISVGTAKFVNGVILDKSDKNPGQEEVVNDKTETLYNTLAVDTTATIDSSKQKNVIIDGPQDNIKKISPDDIIQQIYQVYTGMSKEKDTIK